ncbi:tRNA (adenosine(37)-N6)-threonylcarbamoyltransferase complex ATPase subunit type 1 TsaE [Clostridiaceae bacterium OttesenSCG-928-D20]|nr:tRNA (adenosine(37)-N6)-threonylcarbamoyltransferase complex ATPase subunit type 1 TsaE [Clostridiaceae bacterium OttesenSCG-928-D20]
MEFITNSEMETVSLGGSLAEKLNDRELYPNGAVIAMRGELGSGKTALVRGLARGLGIEDRITSPTFTIVNEYDNKLFHFDMYRLSSADELFDIGWDDYLTRGGIIAIEWSENVSDAFDGSEISISFEKLSENKRKITIGGLLDASSCN